MVEYSHKGEYSTMFVYSSLSQIPNGHTNPDIIVPGCLVLEGGAFRGLYTQGALDAMMENDINVQTTIGVSAGALSGLSYVSGQIGRSARINLHYRHNPDYIGLGAMLHDHGVTGFTFAFEEYDRKEPLDRPVFNDPKRRFLAVATDIESGEPVFFEKGECSDTMKAIQASATVPYVSEPVELDGHLCLDGGCSCPIPVDWAMEQGFDKIMVIRTRDRAYRKTTPSPGPLIDAEYGKYPAFAQKLKTQLERYNALAEHINDLEQQGRVLVLAPEEPVNISRFEGDMEKLGALYWQGYREAMARMAEIKGYFG